jgi:hypothetical protein
MRAVDNTKAPPEMTVYCNCMERVKHHLRIVQSALRGEPIAPAHTDFAMLQAEVIYLHFRKALEEIAFASLSANREKYAAARGGFATEWNARRMLGLIEKINPHFYPLALQPVIEIAPGHKHANRMQEPYLTRQDFENLYDASAEILHAPNPFAPSDGPINVHYTVEQWITRICSLIGCHAIQTPDSQGLWIIQVPRDAPTHAFIAAADGPFIVER